jgi:flagellar hook-basal body complex protein FliE
MTVTHPKHLVPQNGSFTATGSAISALGEKIGVGSVMQTGGFENVMLKALDNVSADQQFSSSLAQAAITDPGSVDVQDITIAQAKASLSLNITTTILNRLVTAWKDIINSR